MTCVDGQVKFTGSLSFLFGVYVEVAAWSQEECKMDVILKDTGQSSILAYHAAADMHRLWEKEDFLMHNKENVSCLLYMTDKLSFDGILTPLPNIDKILIVQYEPKYQEKYAPHQGSSVSIQNLCGFCNLPYEITFRSFYPVSKKSKRTMAAILEESRPFMHFNLNRSDDDEEEPIIHGIKPEDNVGRCESLVMLSGTFKLCSNRTRIDFRGVRSVSLLRDDFKTISGIPLEQVPMYVYMVVLKGNMGKSLFLGQSGASLFEKHGVVDMTHGGPDDCYLANRIGCWCKRSIHIEDVCEVLRIECIDWKIFQCMNPAVDISEMTKNADSVNINISRRGGAIIRLTFPKLTPWNSLCEHQVVSDCNKLLNVLHDLSYGKLQGSDVSLVT